MLSIRDGRELSSLGLGCELEFSSHGGRSISLGVEFGLVVHYLCEPVGSGPARCRRSDPVLVLPPEPSQPGQDQNDENGDGDGEGYEFPINGRGWFRYIAPRRVLSCGANPRWS